MKNQSALYSRYFTYIKPFTKIPIIKTYGTKIFTLLIMLIFIFFAIKPTVETILILQKKLQNATEVLEKVNEKAERLSEAKKNYDNLSEDIKVKIQTAVPDFVELSTVIQSLQQVANVHDSSISALQFQPLTLTKKVSNEIGTLSEIDFTVNFEGVYNNLTAILQDLKSSSRVISIESVTLNKVSEGGGLIMSLVGKAYYLK